MTAKPDPVPPSGVTVTHDRIVLTHGAVTVTVERTDGDRWRLSSPLNYITSTQTPLTYDETFTGTEAAVTEHGTRRLVELADLKRQHDAIHVRVNAMSEGAK